MKPSVTSTTTEIPDVGPPVSYPPGKETVRRVFPVRIYRRCGTPSCRGRIEATGLTFTTMPPSYRHKCSKCGAVYDLSETYPRIEYNEETGP